MRFKTPPATLLDVGTGTGLFVTTAAAAGFTATGLDTSEAALKLADAHPNATFRQQELHQLPEGERFDVITMFDYLEHTQTPAQDVAAAVAHLADGGILAIRLPNREGLQSRVMQEKWFGVISNHLSYFDKHSLLALLERHGLSAIDVYTGNFVSEWEIMKQKYAWIRAKLAARRQQIAAIETMDIAAGQPAIGRMHRVLRLLKSLWLEQLDWFGGCIGMGNNLYVIATKKQ